MATAATTMTGNYLVGPSGMKTWFSRGSARVEGTPTGYSRAHGCTYAEPNDKRDIVTFGSRKYVCISRFVVSQGS